MFWASVECGLVLPSISAWEVVGKEKFGRAAGGPGGSGWHKDKATCLEVVMDEPPEQLYNKWIRDRMEFYKRVEPTEPPRDERLVLGDASTPRMRFSSSNGLGCLHCLVVGHFEQPGEVRAGGHPLGGKGGDLEG